MCLLWRSFQAILSANRECPFLEFVGVTVVEQARSIDRLASRVDAGFLRYTYRCMFRSHSDRSNRISGIRKILHLTGYPHMSGITRVCWVARFCEFLSCSSRLPILALAFLSCFSPFSVFFFSFNFVLEFLLSDPTPSTAFASVCESVMRCNSTGAYT